MGVSWVAELEWRDVARAFLALYRATLSRPVQLIQAEEGGSNSVHISSGLSAAGTPPPAYLSAIAHQFRVVRTRRMQMATPLNMRTLIKFLVAAVLIDTILIVAGRSLFPLSWPPE